MIPPTWFCPPGHPRTEQLGKLWNAGQRERRTGGRALSRVSLPVDVADAEQFPNIAEAVEFARKLRESGHE